MLDPNIGTTQIMSTLHRVFFVGILILEGKDFAGDGKNKHIVMNVQKHCYFYSIKPIAMGTGSITHYNIFQHWVNKPPTPFSYVGS